MSSGEGRRSMVLLNSSFSRFVDLYDNLQESSDTREVRKNRSSEFVIPTGPQE
jgi:hypothetical protein